METIGEAAIKEVELVNLFKELEFGSNGNQGTAMIRTMEYCIKLIDEAPYTRKQLAAKAVVYYQAYLDCLNRIDRIRGVICPVLKLRIRQIIKEWNDPNLSNEVVTS